MMTLFEAVAPNAGATSSENTIFKAVIMAEAEPMHHLPFAVRFLAAATV